MYKLILKLLGKNPERVEHRLTLKLLFITLAIVIFVVFLGNSYLRSGLFLAVSIVGSIGFSLTWLSKETKERFYRVITRHAFTVDISFTLIGIFLAFSVSVMVGLAFFFLGLFLSSSLRLIKHKQGSFSP